MILKILDFLNFLDDDGRGLSWTSIGLAAMLAKILFSGMLDGPSVVALMGLLGNYIHRRHVVAAALQEPKA